MNQPIEPIKVLIVEDHHVVAEGLSSLLEEHPDLTVVGWADAIAEVVPTLQGVTLDVAMVDFRLPDGTGPEAAALIREHDPSAAILFLSADDSDEALLAAVEAGACGYLLKSTGGEDIAQAIRSAAEGETLIPADKLLAVLSRHRENFRTYAEQTGRLDSLTPREQEILALMTQGLDNRTLAAQLSISYATVRTHVRKILEKLGVRSQLEAVAKAIDWGFRSGGG